MKMTRVFFQAFLILVVGAVAAAYSPSVIRDAIMDAQIASAGRPFPLENVPDHNNLKLEPKSSEECKKCTMGSAKWVMEHVIEYLKAKCDSATSPGLQDMCKKAEEADQKVVLGYLIAAVRPASLGYAWCNGKGVCDEDAQARNIILIDGEAEALPVAIDDLFDLSQARQTRLENLQVQSSQESLAGEADEKCKKCIKSTSSLVMFATTGKIVKFCLETDKPEAKKLCELARRHPKETLGFLLYKVRPEEFGYGYCLGNNSCDEKKSQDEGSQMMDDISFNIVDSNVSKMLQVLGASFDSYLLQPGPVF